MRIGYDNDFALGIAQSLVRMAEQDVENLRNALKEGRVDGLLQSFATYGKNASQMSLDFYNNVVTSGLRIYVKKTKPSHQCPKCKSTKIISSGDLSIKLNEGKVNSVETLKWFKCEGCGFEEEWIPEDGSPIMSDLEKEWLINNDGN